MLVTQHSRGGGRGIRSSQSSSGSQSVWYRPELYNTSSRGARGEITYMVCVSILILLLLVWLLFLCLFNVYKVGVFCRISYLGGGGGNGYYTHSVKGNTWCRMNTPRMLTKPSRWITRSSSLSHAIPASLFYNTQIKKNLLTLPTSVPEWKQRHTGVWLPLHALLLHIVLYSHWSLLHVYVCGMSPCAYACLHVCGRMW